jgi:hypothetical protein
LENSLRRPSAAYAPAVNGGSGSGVFVVFALLGILVWLIVGRWVYQAAERKGYSKQLFALVYILNALIAIILVLALSDKNPAPRGYSRHERGPSLPRQFCSHCGQKINPTAAFCASCGQST